MRDYRGDRLDLTGRLAGGVGDTMTEYRTYLLGSDGHIIKRVEFVFRDDVAAINASRQRFADSAFEVWAGARLVYRSVRDTEDRTV